MNKKERKQLIEKISQASGVAQYALQKKMTDEQISKASQNLEIFKLVKPANNYNRYCQSQKTREANDKLKSFLDPQNSEIVAVGRWLINAISKKGNERQEILLEKDLVHKEDHNTTVSGMRDAISSMNEMTFDAKQETQQKIEFLEKRIDSLRNQLSDIEQYIRHNHGVAEWKNITSRFISRAK